MLWRLAARLIITISIVGYLPVLNAQTPDTSLPTIPVVDNQCPIGLDRPCVALVLGGGGARGSAHIGILKALEDRKVPIDIIVGTSIGSFVGGLYASGKSADEIEQLFLDADWNAGYRDDLNRSETPNRRKRQLDSFPIHLDLGLDSTGIKLPKGLIRGQGMKALVDNMLGTYLEFQSFDDLPIPFRAVAADATTGEQVVLGDGDLATAMQISMSLPGILRPIERDGRMLVDGGIANNLPVSVAKSLGAQFIIAVNIGSPSATQDELQSSLSILRQLTSFLTTQNVEYQTSLLAEQDVLVHPEMEGIGMLDFNKTVEGETAGYKAANEAFDNSPAIQALAGQPSRSDTLDRLRPQRLTQVDVINLENNSRLSDDYIMHRMQLEAGETYSPEDLLTSMDRLYGQGTIARINTSIDNVDDENILNLDVEEKEWGPGYLDLKFTFEDDFESFSRYQFGASYRYTNLSPYGAEWYTAAEFGTEKYFLTELYWPIKNSGFYWDAFAEYDRDITSYTEDGDSFGEIITTTTSIVGGIGWNSVDNFDVMLGAIYGTGFIELPVILKQEFELDGLDFDQSGGVLQVNWDSLDDASFPRRGSKLDASLTYTRDTVEQLEDYSTELDLEYNGVVSLGRHTLRTLVRVQSTVNDDPFNLLGGFSLGGFLNLSGTPQESIYGQHVRFGSMVYTYELAKNDFGAITLPLYLGFSAETGNAWGSREEIDYGDLIASASAFVGWDSPLGPAYFAYGHSDTGQHSLYVFLGIVF